MYNHRKYNHHKYNHRPSLEMESLTSSTAGMPVQIILHQSGHPRQALQIHWTRGETVRTLKSKLAQKIGDRDEVEMTGKIDVIFCGKALADRMAIADLELGPLTTLNAKLNMLGIGERKNDDNADNDELDELEEDEEEKAALSSSNEDDCSWVKIGHKNTGTRFGGPAVGDTRVTEDNNIGIEPQFASRFFVFCKSCDRLQRAKLRAYCSQCESSAILFAGGQEPRGWADVRDSNNLVVNCAECEQEQGVNFRFKCVDCDQTAAPLMHVKQQNVQTPTDHCVICGDGPSLCVRLGCQHVSCLPCFRLYAQQLLAQPSLTFDREVGYTIGCPVFECPALVSDVHTFYLLGQSAYQKYQAAAAQQFFNQQISGRHYCPAPGCGAAFFIEEEEEADEVEAGKMFVCPECAQPFCRFCCQLGAAECKCALEQRPSNGVDENELLISEISKPCPKCAAPTERLGGCAHMHCTQCQHDWCFVCQQEWTDTCQWDHWFE